MNRPPNRATERTGQLLLLAWAAFLVSNLIHNNFGLDPAIVPSTLLGVIYAWRRTRRWAIASALFIAIPSFAFLDWPTLVTPGSQRAFANHWALLLAGALAILTIVVTVRETR